MWITSMERNGDADDSGRGRVKMLSGLSRQDKRIWRALGTRHCVLAVWALHCLLPLAMGMNAEIPLISEDNPLTSSHRNEPGCIQDGRHYRFLEKWSPDLIPRGTMHCVKCQCLTIEKKGIIQPRGKVKCKNIKDDCPKPQCDTPVLLPDRCCKICPDSPDHCPTSQGDNPMFLSEGCCKIGPESQGDNPMFLSQGCCKIGPESPGNDFESDFSFRPKGQVTGIYSDDQQEMYKVNEFRALLVGRQVRGQAVRTTSVAVIHISGQRGELRYAVRYSKLDRPKFLQITDANGYVLLDSPIVKRTKRDKKLCGVWHKIPAIYVQYFREGRLFAVITSSKHPDGLVAGRIMPNDMASTEVFSSVLSSRTEEGSGGLASLEYEPSRRVVKYVIHVDGLVNVGLGADYHVSISKGKRVLHQAAASTTPLTTKISGSWKLSKKRERKQLARGRLRMHVTSHNGAVITGVVYPRLMCGVFQAVLSGSNALEKNEAGSAASAIVELGPSGGLDYKIRVEGLDSPMTKIRIETGSAGKRKQKLKKRIVGNLHKSFVADNASFDGWANGTFKKVEAKDVYNMLNNKLYINIATTRRRISQLRGRLVHAPYHDQLKTLDAPTTLVAASPEAGGGAAHAWLTMSPGCSLRYDAVLARHRHRNEVEELGKSFSVLLGSYENRLRRTFLLGPAAGHLISSQFEYNMSSGSVKDVPVGMIQDLDQGKAYLQIISGPEDTAIFRGNVTLHNTCWQYVQDLDSSIAQEEQAFAETARDVCMFEGTRYTVGDSWLPDVNSTCYTCSCMNGGSPVCHKKTCPLSPAITLNTLVYFSIQNGGSPNGGSPVCHKKTCPPLTCDNPVLLEDQCCPTCPGETWSEQCEMDEDPRRYPLHHTWHPFLPLKGFAKCAVCTCKEGDTVECGRVACPKLDCPGHELIRLNKEDCCNVCGPKLERDTSELDRPQLDIDMEGACNFLGHWKVDGETWHPRVKPFGHLKCFVCNCAGGKFDCGRTDCPALRCKKTIRPKGACCDECDPNQPKEAETVKKSERKKKSCTFGGKTYDHRAKWRPPASPNGDTRCARCRCRNGEVKCKIRCPKKCKTDRNYSKCCKHCPEEKRAEKTDVKEAQDKKPSRSTIGQRADFPLT
ncbi:chordin-like [Littorina saxatilis]|uniref:chordin-like n=1 Tax=Littorina saxatilis TaxID=31220 RepID=UPI0038B524DA